MNRRRMAAPTALVVAALVGSVVTLAVRGNPAPAAPKPPPFSTAKVVRTDLATSILTGGTLGYAPTDPVVNHIGGTYTSLPAIGSTIESGQPLFRVDNLPIVLMIGSTPAYRAFGLGMTDGPDVEQLESNLIVLGDARGLFSEPSEHFNGLTAAAVERWQTANGYTADGHIPLGVIVFLATPVLVGAQSVAPGQPAAPGDSPYQVTTSSRLVYVPLNPDLPTVSVGEPVSIVLPSNAQTPGTVIAVGPPPPNLVSSSSSSSSGSGSGSGSSSSSVLTVRPQDPGATGTGDDVGVQVSLTIQRARGVLAVPISALLALAGGGYGVEIVTPSGSHQLTGVTTGIFAGGRVQVSGRGIAPGVTVVVAQ
jgi:peptidoglycan hydrolase-like protein with peptidoglycan-binding domain